MKPRLRPSSIPTRMIVVFFFWLLAVAGVAQAQVILPITISPASRAFGSVAEGTATAAKTFTVTNHQTVSASVQVSTSAPFAETDNCASVPAGGTCTISVTFTPTTTGQVIAPLTLTYSGVGSPQSVTVQGTGVLPITISPTSRAFGQVDVGTTSAAKTFTVTNHQTVSASVQVSTSAPFAETDNCTSVAAGGTCTISVSFTPTTTGQVTDPLTVAYSGVGSPQSVSVQGTGIAPLLIQPASVTFPALRNVGTSSAPHNVTLTNRSTAPLTIDSITISPTAYAITANTCTSPLAPAGQAGASCTVTVVFTPTVACTTPGTLSITYGDSHTLVAAALTGSAQVNNLVSIAITAPNASLAAGLSEQLTATGTYAGGTTGNVTATAVWNSLNPAVATVGSNTGIVTGVSQGSATITATVTPTTAGQSPVSGTASITITPKIIQSVTVSAPSASIYPLGTDQFTATAHYSDGTTAALPSGGVAATFASSNPGVATINSATGLATGVLFSAANVPVPTNTTNITATVPGVPTSLPFALTVAGVQSVAVTPAAPTFPLGLANASLPFGPTNNTVQFTATATYTDNTTVNVTSTATWQSSATTVAIISAGGTATVTQPAGSLTTNSVSTTISATYGASGSTTLTVQPPIYEGGFAVCLGVYPSTTCGTSTTSVGVTLGLTATQPFSAVGTFSDGSTQNLTNLATWISHDMQEVTVNGTGLATVVATDNASHAVTATYGGVAAYGYANEAWVTASGLQPTCTSGSPTIDMKLLVVTNNALYNATPSQRVDFPAITQILDYVGTPYVKVDVTDPAPTLSDGVCHGYYQGVIFSNGADFYAIPWESALVQYEGLFKVRQVNWYDSPDNNFGLSETSTSINLSPGPPPQTYSANFTPAAVPIFFYANTSTPLSFSLATIYLAPTISPGTSPSLSQPSLGGPLTTVTPLLTDSSNNALSVIATYANGQQYLTQLFDSNPALMHDLVVAYGLLNWVTHGVFLGDYHVYATQQVDDFFISDTEWIPSTTCLTNPLTQDRTAPDASNLPVFRVDSADMAALASWQANVIQKDPSNLFSNFKLTMALNGVGTAGNGDWTGMTAPIQSDSATGSVATFTIQSPNGFSGMVGQTVTISGSSNGLNGTYTIAKLTSTPGNPPPIPPATTPPVTPATTTFTVNLPSPLSFNSAPEPAAATAAVTDDLVANLGLYESNFHWISHTYDHPGTLNGLCQSTVTGSNPDGTPCGDTDNPPVDSIDLEILTNRWVASDPAAQPSWKLDTDPSDILKQLTFTDFNPGNIVTPGITGLNDPNVPTYLYNDGIRFAVSDTSVTWQLPDNGPNPSPNVGIVNVTPAGVPTGIYEVPRHPNDVFYNAADWADDQAEFVCIFSHYVPAEPPGVTPPPPIVNTPYSAWNASQILDYTSGIFLQNMLMGDMDPEMFHQPDLHFSDNSAALTATGPNDPLTPGSPFAPVPIPGVTAGTPHASSLISDTYDLTFYKYKQVYNLPVLTPTLDGMGGLMQNRNSFNLSGVTASIVGAGTAAAQITLTIPGCPASGFPAPFTCPLPQYVIPVTGLVSTGSELYGGQNISHITMNPSQTIAFPVTYPLQ